MLWPAALAVKKRLWHNRSTLVRIFLTISRRDWPLLLLLALVLASGCYWLRYYDLMETHVELMESMADSGGRILEAGSHSLAPSDISRLAYPLERARQFAEISRKRYAGRESLAAFDAVVAAYGELHHYLDRIRVQDRSEEHLRTVAELLSRVHARAARTREVIARERR